MKPFDFLLLTALLTLGIIAVATDTRRKRPVLLPQAPPSACKCGQGVSLTDGADNSLEWRAPMPAQHVPEPLKFSF
jgi:hypothetical protein